MKKSEIKKMALMGIIGGIIINSSLQGADANTSKTAETAKKQTSTEDYNAGNLGYHLYTEDELLLELNNSGAKMYQALDQEGKQLALKVASQRCNQTNECKGLNACQTDKNACAGKGQCKGTGKCAIGDKNLAVKLVSEKMASKRSSATK